MGRPLMKHRSTLLLLIAGLVAASQSASLPRISSSNEFGPLPQSAVCAQTCNLLNRQIQYTPGQTYVYNVQLMTRIGEQANLEDEQACEPQEVQITAVAEISAYSQCELVMKLRGVTFSGFEHQTSERSLAAQLESSPIHFALEDGVVTDVCADQADEQWLVDVKKSIISALQMSSESVAQQQTLIETDISGRCETVYEPLESNSEVTVIRKTKNRSKCSDRHQANIAFFPASYGINQALQSSLSPLLTANSSNECTQVVKGQIVESVACEDRQTLRYPLNIPITSRVELQLTERRPEITVQRIEEQSFRRHRLTLSSSSYSNSIATKDNSLFSSTIEQSERRKRDFTVSEVQHLLKGICAKVAYSVHHDVPVLFHELITALHYLPAADQAQVWTQVHSGAICSSPKLQDLFLDAAALSGSEGSVEVLLQAYQQQHVISPARANYLFGLLAFSKQPTVGAARRLVNYIKGQHQQNQLVQLPRGVLFGATGFVHNLQVVAEQRAHQMVDIEGVRAVVRETVSTLIEAIKTIIPQASTTTSPQQQQQALTLIYSLKNLVLVQELNTDEQLTIARQLVDILRTVSHPHTTHSVEISAALVRTLVNAGIDDSIRQYLIESILIQEQSQQPSIELQIEAYRAVVLSGATQSQLQLIKQWTERASSSSKVGSPQQQLVNYIRSHQANLRTTSDPHKQAILPAGAPVFESPSGAWFGVSRNYELSYVNQGIGAGVTLETDVIYQGGKQSSPGSFIPVPQTVAFNFTIPIGGQELQLVEVRLHQHGLEPLIEKHMRQMEQSSSRASFASQPWKVARETLKYIIAHGSEILEENPSVRVLLQVIVDGKTVVLADEQDLISNDSSIEEQSFMQELMARLHSTVTIDRAFAVTPIDSVVRFPSVNGLPVTVRLNSTFVIGFKSEVAVDIRNPEDSVVSFAIYPSVAATTETAVAFHAGPEKKVVEYVQSVSSAPQLNFLARVNRGRIVTFKVDLPKEKYSLARIESVVYSRNAISGERVRLTPKKIAQIAKYPDVHICSRATEKALGVSICYDLSYGTVHHGHGLDIIAEVTVVKTDAGLSSYEATLESPLKFGQIVQAISGKRSGALKKEVIEEMTPFRFHFNTPGSEVDRKIALEVELANAGALVKEARLRLRTPWKAISGQAVLRNEAKERVAKLELTVDEAKWMAAEVALEVVRRGPKTEWKPRVVITALESVLERPIHLTGALSVNRGRKTAVHLSLEDVIARQQYITAGYIRERPSERNGLGRTSADLSVSLRGLVAKGAAAFELGERLIKVDISSDYKLPSWRRAEKAKVALKLQNHSNNEGEKKVIKMTGIGQIKASQLSKYEISYSQNVHVISGEQLEHDLKLDWASQQEDSSDNTPQIRLHQSAKKTGQRGKIDLEATSLVIYRPENVHYEVKATGGLVGVGVSSGLKRYNIAIAGEGKHSSKSNFRGELSYEQKAKSPALKMEMAAQLKAPEAGIDFVYRDEIEEKAPGQYHGHLLVQMSPAEKYDVTYVYRLKNDRSKKAVEHSMEVMLLKDARKRVALKHYGLLRLENGGRAMSLKSRLTDEENKGAADIWNAQVDLAPGRKEISFSHLPREIRAQAKYEAVYQGPSSAQWSFSSPAFNHQAEYENSGPQGQYWSFDSKTKKAGENLMEIQSKHNAKLGHRRLRLSSQYFDGECELELPSTNEQSKKAKLRFDLPNSWAHESTFSRAPISSSGGLILVDSRTQYQGAPVVDLAARYDPQSSAGQFKLNTPLNSVEMQAEMAQAKKIALKKALLKVKRGADYEHQSQLAYEPSTSAIDFESVTSKSGKDMAKVKYQYSGDEQLLHQFDLATPEDYSVVGGQWSGRFDQRRRSAKIDWTNKAAGMKHNTQISCAEPQQQIISIDSSTTDYQTDAPILLVKGAMDPKERSYISLQSGKARKVNFETRRSKRSAKLDLDYDQYRHQSEISGGDYDDDNQQQQWKAKSSTRKAGKSIFDFDAQIQPSQQYGHISLSRGNNGELFKHESTFKMEKMMDQQDKKSAHLKSNTLYRGEPLAELDAMLSGLRGANKVDGSIIGYELKSLLDVPSQVASVDLKSRRSGRHLLGSVAVNQEAQADRSFHFDFAWDIDRDPASKVALDLLIKRVPIESRSRSAGQQVMIEASAAYAESKLVYNMQYVPKSGGFSSPHPIRLSLSFIPSPNAIHNQRDSWQLIYLHRMEQSDKSAFTCKWEWIVGGQRQYSLQINGKIEEEAVSGSKKFIFSAKTTAPASKPQLAATFNLVAGQRAPNQYFFDASATAHGDQKRYQAVFDLTKHLETRKVDGKLEIRLPAFQVHVAAFSLDLTERKFSLELINEKTGKVVEVEASYAHHLTHLKVASQGASSWFVPKVDALVRYVPGEELHARLALDEERKFELTAKYSGELSKLKFYMLTKVDSVYTPSVEFIAEGRKPSEDDGSSGIGAQRSVAITGKWNMVEVVKGSFNQAAVRQWTAEGFVAAVGSGDKIVEGSVVSTPGQSEHYTTYEVKVQPKESNVYGVKAFGAKIEERRPTAENEYIRSVKVELFQQAAAEEAEKKLILSTEVSLKHRKWAQVPEMVEVSLRHIPSASHGSLSVAIREQVKESEQQEDYSSLFSTAPETASIASQKRSSVLRDQMLIGWNQKSVGFALITSEWASAEAVEHSLKVYTPSGRVVKHRCGHVWSDELIFLKQSLKTDEKTQREPLYQSTVIVQKSNPIQGGSYIASGYTGKLVIESFKFARSPKTVSFEVKPASQQRPLDAKLIIDIAQSEKEALTLKAVVERKAASTSASNGRYDFGVASLNQTIHFEAKSADASVLDFAVDGHVSQSSVGLLWKNLNRKGRQQQGHYLLQFIGEDRFETVLSNPAAQYHVSGIYKRKDIKEEGGSPMVMDLTIKKSISKHSNSYAYSSKSQPMLVSEHKVHIESTDRCIRAEIEDAQKISSSRQVNLCADLKRANIFNLDIDSISGSGQKTAEFSARLDAKSAAKTLALGAHWNPVYSRKLLQTLLNIKESSSSSEDLVDQISRHEVVQELSAKYSALFRSLFANAAQPLTEVAKELAPIAAEYGLTEEVIQKWTAAAWAPIGAAIDSVSEYSRENIDQLTGAYTEAVEEVKKACARSTSCRSVSEALEKGNEEVARLASRSIVGLLQKTHRFVVKTKGGALLEKLNAEEMIEQLRALVPEPVTEAIKSAAQTAYGWARDVTLNPSGPFAGVLRHLENIFGELIKGASGGSDSIRWERIESSVSEAVHLLASPSAWASSVRVLLWDPVNGQLAVEVKSPQTFTTAAAIAGMGNENINSNSSSSSWLNGINSYDRYAAKARFF